MWFAARDAAARSQKQRQTPVQSRGQHPMGAARIGPVTGIQIAPCPPRKFADGEDDSAAGALGASVPCISNEVYAVHRGASVFETGGTCDRDPSKSVPCCHSNRTTMLSGIAPVAADLAAPVLAAVEHDEGAPRLEPIGERLRRGARENVVADRVNGVPVTLSTSREPRPDFNFQPQKSRAELAGGAA